MLIILETIILNGTKLYLWWFELAQIGPVLIYEKGWITKDKNFWKDEGCMNFFSKILWKELNRERDINNWLLLIDHFTVAQRGISQRTASAPGFGSEVGSLKRGT